MLQSRIAIRYHQQAIQTLAAHHKPIPGKEAKMNLIAIATLMLAGDLHGQPLPDVVLLDFTAGYCQPCRQMVPVLQEMENASYPIRRIDITQHPETSQQYKVDRIPTLILLVEGQEVRRFQGITDQAELRQAMNDAARKLEQTRQRNQPAPIAAPAVQPSKDIAASPFDEKKPTVAPRPGLRGMFDKMRRGFAGEEEPQIAATDAFPPEFRGQSPDDVRPNVDTSPAMQATVRVRLTDGNLRDVGSGTIIHSAAGQSIILTCAHIFQKVDTKSASVEVDVFQDGKALLYPAQVLGGDHESDVALLRIRNTTPLPTASLVDINKIVEKQEALFSIGCSNGDVPTRLNMQVIEVDRYDGPENILCTNDPAQGRSGGGLFDVNNRIVGVCSAADRKAREGLYTGVTPVRELITQLKLDSLFESAEPAFESADPTPAVADVPQSPFGNDQDDLFDQMFAEETSLAEFADTGAVSPPVFNEPSPPAVQPQPQLQSQPLPDPFAAAPAVTATAMSERTGTTPEITVLIDDPIKGKRMVVIPKPSPWLLELLTGEKPASSASGLVNARDRTLSTTSTRTARKVTNAPRTPFIR